MDALKISFLLLIALSTYVLFLKMLSVWIASIRRAMSLPVTELVALLRIADSTLLTEPFNESLLLHNKMLF